MHRLPVLLILLAGQASFAVEKAAPRAGEHGPRAVQSVRIVGSSHVYKTVCGHDIFARSIGFPAMILGLPSYGFTVGHSWEAVANNWSDSSRGNW